MKLPRHTSVVAILLFLLSLHGSPANASLEVCNEAGGKVWIAIAYVDQEGHWTSEGWWRADPDQCVPAFLGDPEGKFYYIHIEREGDQLSTVGNHVFCVHRPDKFKIRGIGDCRKRGYDEERFVEIATAGKPHWTGRVVVYVSKKGRLAIRKAR